MTAAANTTAAKTILIERTFDAPRDLVFRAWIEPKHLMKWFYASDGWTTPHAEIEPRKGGRFNIGFRSPEGQGFDLTGSYSDFVEDERLVMLLDDGRPVTIEFDDKGAKTHIRMTLTLEGTHSEEQQREGWTAMLIHLGEHLATL
jgi:uncharacterized protein YndB with AHSA1/START domain